MHIFQAFKPHDAPATNFAEVGHSRLAIVGRPKMSLFEAAREDVLWPFIKELFCNVSQMGLLLEEEV